MGLSAKELRIGNLVSASGKEFQVGWIGWSGIGSDKVDANHEDVEGIPLSPEWLERFNFQVENDAGNWNEPSYVIYKHKENWFRLGLSGEKIYYNHYTDDDYYSSYWPQLIFVHHLQNLYFALTGTELQISEP